MTVRFDRNRAIQRLATRGELTVRLDLADHVTHIEWDGVTQTCWHGAHPDPSWIVWLARPAKGIFYAAVGWNDVWVRDADLDTALAEALIKSAPRRSRLDERVWEHQDFVDLLDFLALLLPSEQDDLQAS